MTLLRKISVRVSGAMNQKCPEVAVPFVVNLEPAENGAKDGAENTDQKIR